MPLARRTALAFLIAVPARAQPAVQRVVASFSILADMVREVGGSRVAVHALAGPEQDLHGFEPRPSDLQAVAGADAMVINGLGLEGWAERIVAAVGFRGTAIVASRGVAALRAGGGHNQGTVDPHAWQDVTRARRYVANIRDGLTTADPAGANDYARAAARYDAELEALDAQIRAVFADIPRAQRRAVTSHDAFAYFAGAYGVDMLAIAGTFREAEPSARELAALVAQVKRQNIRALFLENAANPAALRALSRETGVAIGGRLYPDALSAPGGPAGSYIAMMRHNASTIAAALR